MNDFCSEHSGCLNAIDNLKINNIKQWEHISKMDDRIDKIMTRLNVILGGIAVAVLMLAINLVIKVN